MDEAAYRYQIRNNFMAQINKSKLQASHYCIENLLSSQGVENKFNKLPQFNRNSDEAVLYRSPTNTIESHRRDICGFNPRDKQEMKLETKVHKLMHSSSASSEKSKRENVTNYDIYEWQSKIRSDEYSSVESTNSRKSSKTLVSKPSWKDLRKLVKSQCKIHEVIDESLKQLSISETDPFSKETIHSEESPPVQKLIACKHIGCGDNVQHCNNQKDVMTQIGTGDIHSTRSNYPLNVSVDDVIDSKIISPMIRQLQHLHRNNLREKMSLIEDLELVPQKVNDVYKTGMKYSYQ